MKRSTLILSGLLIGFISALIGFQFARLNSINESAQATVLSGLVDMPGEEVVGQLRPSFNLPDMRGNLHDIAEWDGMVLVINFWATWCPPCREEIPEFIRLQKAYEDKGLQFIGIALQRAEDVQEFVQELGINYPILVGEEEVMRVAKNYGNYLGALPYTVIIDRQSRITLTKRGPLLLEAAEQAIIPLL